MSPGTPPEELPSLRRRRHAGRALRVLLALLVLFGLLELVTRVVLYRFADPHTFLTYASARERAARPELVRAHFRYAPHRYLGYLPRRGPDGAAPAEATAAPKRPGEFRIVSLGGGPVAAAWAEEPGPRCPPALEAELRARGRTSVTVLELGVDGHTSHEQLLSYLLRVRPLEPDLVIVEAGFNDTFARLVWPPAAHRPDNSGFRLAAVDETLAPALWEHSALLRVAGVTLGRLPSRALLRSVYDRVNERTFVGEQLRAQLLERRHPDGLFREVAAERIFAANTDEYALRNLASLVALVQHDGARAVLVAAPPEEPLAGFPPFRTALEATHRHIEELATRTGAAWLEPGAAPVDGQPCSPAKDRVLAEFLLARGLVPEASDVAASPSPEAAPD